MTTADGEQREVGGYRLLRRLGSGGMGTVHEAVDADGRHVALKLLHPHISADPQARKRLAREVSLLHRVREAGIARVLDAEVEDAEAFVVTELVEGPTLEEDVAADGPFSPSELSHLAHGLAEALRAIHAVGVVHRDFKPGNVMMSEHGPVVIDFGIAQVADDARLTQTGMVTGTPGYLDPEVIAGAEPSPTCDWWGWAAVLLFAATGRPPFGRGPTGAVLARVTTGQADTEGLEPVVAKALRGALDPQPGRRLGPDGVLAVLDGQWGDDKLTQALQVGAAGALAAGAGLLAGGEGTPALDGGPATAPFTDGTRAAAMGLPTGAAATDARAALPATDATAAMPATGATAALPAPGATAALPAADPTAALPAADSHAPTGAADAAGRATRAMATPETRALPADPPTRAMPVQPATQALPADPPVMPASYPPRRPEGALTSYPPAHQADDRTAVYSPVGHPGAPGYPAEHGYGPGGHTVQGQPPQGYPGQAYPGQGQVQGYPGPGYPESYPAPGYPGQPQPGEAPPAWARPPRRRTLVVATVGVGVAAVATAFPGAFLVAAAALLLLTATTGWAGRSRRAARLRRGPRPGDDARMLAGLPWHLLRGALSVLPGVVVGAVVGGATWWVLTSLGDPRLGPPLVLGIAAAAALLAAWFTPGGWTARQGARAMVDVLTPTRGFRTLLVVLVLVVAALLVAQTVVLAPAPPSWAPLPGPPFGI
ncbi:serine/threonine-protein kinase [Georgenia ruanii]|nr:serine/threonine-protein kinase [Georgenia ruanii]MPV89687.1 protein kinase [Georgenia ruanii]